MDQRQENIYHELKLRDTKDLLKIRDDHDLQAWVPEVFVIVEEILRERLGSLPAKSRQGRARELLEQADRHWQAGNTSLALEKCGQAIDIAPLFANAYNLRGLLYDEMGELEKALADYQQAVRLDPEAAGCQR